MSVWHPGNGYQKCSHAWTRHFEAAASAARLIFKIYTDGDCIPSSVILLSGMCWNAGSIGYYLSAELFVCQMAASGIAFTLKKMSRDRCSLWCTIFDSAWPQERISWKILRLELNGIGANVMNALKSPKAAAGERLQFKSGWKSDLLAESNGG